MILFIVSLNFSETYTDFIEKSGLHKGTDQISVVIVLDNKKIRKDKVMFTDDLEYNQNLIMNLREQNKDYYLKNNNDFVKKIYTKGDVNISEYSPIVFIKFDNYNSYLCEKEAFKKLSKSYNVDKIYVEKTPKYKIAAAGLDANVNASNTLKLVSIEEAKNMININKNLGYTGEGVKVGILDIGYPNNTFNFPNNEIVDHKTLLSTPHTNKVASIIGGTYGIASEADLFIHSWDMEVSNYNLDDGIEWLLGKGVNVVNISMYSDYSTGNEGQYDGYSAYLDYIVWDNYLTIVVAAGNKGDENDYVTNPGIGMNTISVGSIDGDKNISYYSSWDVNNSIEGVLINPTVVASGENIIIPNTENSELNSSGTALVKTANGTSYAAPMVTGIIALLMEEFPRLMEFPEVFISAIISGASKLPSQTSILDDHAGAGLINYEKTREILSNSDYVNYTTTNSTNENVAIISKEISIGAYDKIDYCLFSIQNSNITSPSSTIYTPNISSYQIIIYDSDGSTVWTFEYGENSNFIIGTLTNSSTTTKEYIIKVFLNEKTSVYNEYLSLSVSMEIHSHLYDDSYLWKNYTTHNSFCRCGSCQIQGHVISSNSYSSSQNYTTCLLCGGLAEIGFIQQSITSSLINQVSINGSFILPNGVVVLTDEDINSYYNGTLIFYNKENVPATQ